jgi:hypothetical protein
MCEVDYGGDRFRPQGASSPLLTPLDESSAASHPSSIEYDAGFEPTTTSTGFEPTTTSKPKILSPCDKNVSTSFRRKSYDGVRRKSNDESKVVGKTKSMRKLSSEFGVSLPSRSGKLFIDRFGKRALLSCLLSLTKKKKFVLTFLGIRKYLKYLN